MHRGALVALGYWNDPERTAERFRPAPGREPASRMPELAVWSGDTVVRDEEGFLYFVGRTDEMIKTSGYRVSPTEIEEVAYATGLVARRGRARRRRRRARASRSCSSSAAADGELRPETLLARAAGASCRSTWCRASRRARRAAALPQRQVRPHAAAPGARRVSATRRSRRSAASTASSRVGGDPARAARRAGRQHAVLRLRPAAAHRARRAAARHAARRASTQLRGQGQPDAGRRPAPAPAWSTRFDVASAGEMRIALDTPMPRRARSASPGPARPPPS